MERYPKLFIKAGLIYLLVGVVLGIGIGVVPDWSARLRFVHIHLNLLGFMVMMIAGVAYHVLPRFSAKPLPWPEGLRYHFILQNIGLVGMVVSHAAGGLWQTGVFHVLFILFSITAGAGLGIMCYNLYSILVPTAESPPPTKISAAMKVSEVLDKFPAALPIFLQNGFAALANPAARKTFARVVSIDKACRKHGVDTAQFLRQLNAALFGKPPAGSPQSTGSPEEAHQVGDVIRKGEYCKPGVMVGSLIKIYPETKAVFESHYGAGCFSCPGQAFETVEQTAQMHNVDVNLILGEINMAIKSALKD
ncbi:MAG: DUF1858 domain-containing protein [Nitrospinales bacterium]